MSWLDSIVAVLFIAAVGYVIFYAYATVTGIIDAFKGFAKESKVLAPSPLTDCPVGKEKSGALCYNPCRQGYERKAATCWLKDVGVGMSSPSKKACDSGQRDDGTSCWDDFRCNTWCDGGRDLFGNCYAWNLKTSCSGSGKIVKTAFDRYDCSGKDLIGALCYDKCPAGMEHIPGVPTKCRPVGSTELSYTPTDDPGVPMTCGPGKVQSGALCYDDPGPGWKVEAGVAWKNCPDGTKDIGALCLPGGSTGEVPWYLSFYMLLAACAVIVACVIYWRVRMVYSMVTGAGRRRGTKTH